MQLSMRIGSRHKGATMIEVLVSIVLASFALLALAGVNASSVRYTKMSQYRATAAQLANDMGERIRANKGVSTAPATGFFAGSYDYSDDFAAQAAAPTLPGELCNQGASNCTPAQIAALDLAQWRTLVRNQLPEGSVFLTRQSAQVAIDLWIAWRDPSVANADEAPAAVGECPAGLNLGADTSVRCSYFRINL